MCFLFRCSVKRAAPRPYSFGLGKRAFDDDTNALTSLHPEDLEFIKSILIRLAKAKPNSDGLEVKRSKPQRFAFGLGKRSEEVVAQDDTAADSPSVENWVSPDKRKADRYSFGLGKRSKFMSDWFGIQGPKSARNIDEFKRRYNFGLGK